MRYKTKDEYFEALNKEIDRSVDKAADKIGSPDGWEEMNSCEYSEACERAQDEVVSDCKKSFAAKNSCAEARWIRYEYNDGTTAWEGSELSEPEEQFLNVKTIEFASELEFLLWSISEGRNDDEVIGRLVELLVSLSDNPAELVHEIDAGTEIEDERSIAVSRSHAIVDYLADEHWSRTEQTLRKLETAIDRGLSIISGYNGDSEDAFVLVMRGETEVAELRLRLIGTNNGSDAFYMAKDAGLI